MNLHPESVEELLRRMRQSEPPGDSKSHEDQRRRRVISGMEAKVARSGRPSKRSGPWPLRWGVAAAAAIVGFVAGGLLVRGLLSGAAGLPAPATALEVQGLVHVVRDEVKVPLSDSTALEPEDVILTESRASASLLTARGVRLTAGPSSRLRLLTGAVAGEEHIELSAGRLAVDVPELGPKPSFAVATDAATIVVHGTRFSVVVEPGLRGRASVTSVSVTRGEVTVRSYGKERRLVGGETWSSEPPPPSSDATATVAPDAPDDLEREASPRASRAGPTSAVSSLSAENRLYQAAMDAKRRGDDARAAEQLGLLLDRYPHSPLAPSAALERGRALSRLGRASSSGARDGR